MARENERAVISGLLALVLVAVLVGGIVAGGAMLFSQSLGLVGDGVSVADEATERDSLYLPTPEPTESATLSPGGPASAGGEGQQQPEKQETTKKPQKQISLSVTQDSVSRMGRIDLTGTYRGGEGSVLEVQRFEDGSWGGFPEEDDPVTASVRNGTFTTYVQTGRSGKNRFRMADTDSEQVSNPVHVTVQ